MNGYQDFYPILNGTFPKSCCKAYYSDCTPDYTFSLSCFQALDDLVHKRYFDVVYVGSGMLVVIVLLIVFGVLLAVVLAKESNRRHVVANPKI
jgi:hypothetical protein